jgi:hypothetical protein
MVTAAAIITTLPHSPHRTAVLVGISTAAVALAIPIAAAETFRPVAAAVDCSSSQPSICVTSEYEVYRNDFEESISTTLVRLDLPEWATPVRLTQDATDRGSGVGFIPALHQFQSDPSAPVIGALINSYLDSCESAFDEPYFDSSVTVIEWIQQGVLGVGPQEDEVTRDDALKAIEHLRQCSR